MSLKPTSPLKVLIVNDHGNVNGGSAQVAIVSASLLKGIGVDVEYICAVKPIDGRLSEAGIPVTCLEQYDILENPSRREAAVQGIWNSKAVHELRRILGRCSRDNTVVHVHGWTKALSASIFKACQQERFAVVHTLHEYFSACPNGGFFDYQKHEICERTALSFDCLTTNCDSRSYAQKGWRVIRQYVARDLAKVPSSLTDVIYLSNISRRVLQPYYGINTNWHGIRNPIAIDRPKQPARPADSDKYLFVGRLVPEKGADVFVAACNKAGVKGVVIGDGSQLTELKAKAKSIEFTGWVSPARVKELLLQSRALILPSRWYEGQPLVVQEALALGVPVIVSDRTGATEEVIHGENGFWFKCGSESDLIEKIKMMNDDIAVEAMGACAYERYWRNPPTPERHAEELVLLYSKIIDKQRS